jgi:hypothetical protein
MIIDSNRKFGVEIEFSSPNEEALRKISRAIPVQHDGSLRGLPFPGEYVSPVLRGARGEDRLINDCEILKKHGALSEDPATSVHIHLDAGKQEPELRMSRTVPTGLGSSVRVIAVSSKLMESTSVALIKRSLSNNLALFPVGVCFTKRFDEHIDSGLDIIYHSKVKLSKVPRIGYRYYWLESSDNFDFLKNVLYFYTQYSDVMQSLVSFSRRFPNMYCVPLNKSFDVESIEKLKSMNELRRYWYKDNESSRKHDDSRYHDVNIHCYFNGPGTVEIRSHGGTLDPVKILLWVRLHQAIVDKLQSSKLKDIKSDGSLDSFIAFVNDPILTKYIKRLVGYYSDKNN